MTKTTAVLCTTMAGLLAAILGSCTPAPATMPERTAPDSSAPQGSSDRSTPPSAGKEPPTEGPPAVTPGQAQPHQPAPAEHTVTVRVSGPNGSVFRVTGAVFGDTGPIAMPDNGSDSASFPAADVSDLGLNVSIMPGPNPRVCAIEIDGTTVVTKTADGDNPVTCTSTHAV